jgi:hypothetical protein
MNAGARTSSPSPRDRPWHSSNPPPSPNQPAFVAAVADLLTQYFPAPLYTALADAFSSAASAAGTPGLEPSAALLEGLTVPTPPAWLAGVQVPAEATVAYAALQTDVASLRPSIGVPLPTGGAPLISVGSSGPAQPLRSETQSFGFTTGTVTTTDGAGAATTKVFTSAVNTLAPAGSGDGGSGPSTRTSSGDAARPTGVREVAAGLAAVLGMAVAL